MRISLLVLLPAILWAEADSTQRHRALRSRWFATHRDVAGIEVVADSIGEGWSILSAPVWGQDTLPTVVDHRYIVIGPDGNAVNEASTDRNPYEAAAWLSDTGSEVCRSEAFARSVEGWIDRNGRAGNLVWPGEAISRKPMSWGKFGAWRNLLDLVAPRVKFCQTDMMVRWRTERDSGSGNFPMVFLAVRDSGRWRLADRGMAGSESGVGMGKALDLAIRGRLRGAPDLDLLWPDLLWLGDARHAPKTIWPSAPWNLRAIAGDWEFCLDGVYGLGGDCLRWKADGTLKGTARLEALPGWKTCMGTSCRPLDTVLLRDHAKETLKNILYAEATERDNNRPPSRTLSTLIPMLPNRGFVVTWSPSPREPGKRHTELKICLRSDKGSCLGVDPRGCLVGSGVFRKTTGPAIVLSLADNDKCKAP